MRQRILWAALPLALLFAAPAAQAQGMFNSIGSNGKPPPAAPKVAPPPALPGAQSNNNGAAPASREPTDMEPNDALFDAINRGDLAGARDAISRGADLDAHNILGMTPMELSVDLGRNDISFLLLSMRGGDSGGQRPPSKLAAAPPRGKQAKQTPPAHSPKVATATAQPAVAQTPRLFAGDGGTPNPNAGFLGFDSGRR
jgi:hypothetical protein